MTTVAIIGAGDVGAATAERLARRGVADRVLFVDEASAVAAGKALDIRQAGAITGSHVVVTATDLVAEAAGAHVFVIADPADAGSDSASTAARLRRLLPYVGAAPLVFAAADQHQALDEAAGPSGLPARRLLGAGALAVTAAAVAAVALEADCSTREVSLVVLGAPPAGFVVPWSQASISGLALERVLAPPHIARAVAHLARLWPPGPYALGSAAATVVEAVLTQSRETIAVFKRLEGEFGMRGRVAAVPALLDAGGLARVVEPELTPRERLQLETALGW